MAKFGEELKKLDADLANVDRDLKAIPAAKKAEQTPPLTTKLADLKKQHAEIERRRAELQAQGPYEELYAVAEGKPQNARIQKRGEPKNLGDEVPRRFLEILGADPLPPTAKGSGRLELAQWLTRPQNPLTARVMVNRIWQNHFGAGIVRTENDFGARGMRPTHPELLDYLASQFIASGWSVKAMHRLIMLSSTYQLAAEDNAHDEQVNPGNELLWRSNRQRLDAESIRDAMLWLGGNLDRSEGGPHPFPPVASWNFTQHEPFAAVYDTHRRSVYLMTSRLARHPYLELFDGADPNATTAQRSISTVPTQALYLMNSPFVHAESGGLAARLIKDRSDDPSRVELAYQLVLAREPGDQEKQQALEFLGQYRQRFAAAGRPRTSGRRSAWRRLPER